MYTYTHLTFSLHLCFCLIIVTPSLLTQASKWPIKVACSLLTSPSYIFSFYYCRILVFHNLNSSDGLNLPFAASNAINCLPVYGLTTLGSDALANQTKCLWWRKGSWYYTCLQSSQFLFKSLGKQASWRTHLLTSPAGSLFAVYSRSFYPSSLLSFMFHF